MPILVNKMPLLENKVAIITGAANGIGKATAKLFAKEGASVVIADWNYEKAEEVYKEIIRAGGEALPVKVDVTDMGSVLAMAQTALNEYRTIDVLINNAGIVIDSTLLKAKREDWDRVISVNMTGIFNCTSVIAEVMAGQGKGNIINASSVVAGGNIGQTSYAATKAAVKSMTVTWGRELGRKGIRVNAVAPGYTATDMMNSIPDHVLDKLKAQVPLKRLGEPEEIAEAYLWLASDKSKYVNGTCIHIDGGLTI